MYDCSLQACSLPDLSVCTFVFLHILTKMYLCSLQAWSPLIEFPNWPLAILNIPPTVPELKIELTKQNRTGAVHMHVCIIMAILHNRRSDASSVEEYYKTGTTKRVKGREM